MKTDLDVKRSRRLRKKLYVNEYTVYGFEVSVSFNDIDETTLDSFLDQVVDFVESNNLIIGGGGGVDVFDAFIYSKERYGSASEEDRNLVSEWLNSQAVVANADVGELVDANYGF